MVQYQAFHLTIHSDLPFLELQPVNTALSPDVFIRYGAVNPQGLEAPLKKSIFFQAKPGAFWLHIPQVARFLVTEGQHITIDPIAGADEDSLRLFLLGSCFGALLMQRGLLLLHGNAVQVGQYAVSFVGLSGAGKSTMSAILFKKGYSILADDVCAINKQSEVIPSFPQIKIWADTATHLHIDTSTLRRIRPHIEKYAMPLGEKFYPNTLPLRMIYILNGHNQDDINLVNFSGVDKFKPLHDQLYRGSYVKGLMNEREHNMRCGQLANRVALARVNRPNAGYYLHELTDYIEADLAARGL